MCPSYWIVCDVLRLGEVTGVLEYVPDTLLVWSGEVSEAIIAVGSTHQIDWCLAVLSWNIAPVSTALLLLLLLRAANDVADDELQAVAWRLYNTVYSIRAYQS